MLIKKDQDLIQSYLEDNSNIPRGYAIGVAIPENESEIVSFMRETSATHTPVTISGGGTGTTGGRVPYGGYILSLANFNHIKEIGSDYAAVEPGVIYQDLEKELSAKKLLFPPNPTETTSFIGGNIATNASGSRTYLYGATRNYITGLRVVLSDGETLVLNRGKHFADNNDMFNLTLPSGRKLSFRRPAYTVTDIKNAAGYFSKPGMDLIDLFIGSEGTLGIITEITLNVIPGFKNLCAFFVFLAREQDALSMVQEITQKPSPHINPLAIEYFDSNSLRLIGGKYPRLPQDAASAIYLEQDIPADEEETLSSWLKLFERYNVPDDHAWFGQTAKDLSFYHDIRHSLPERINELVKQHHHIKLSSDIAVPRRHLDKIIAVYKQYFLPSGISYYIFGHIGDAHLHTNLLPDTASQVKQAGEIYMDIMKEAVNLGGTISAEHGIGKIKYEYLKIMYGAAGIEEMKRAKKALDPAGILNQGNIFPCHTC